MESLLELHDIQGNIIKAYGRFGFPKARFIFYHINQGWIGREFVKSLAPSITTSAPWMEHSQIPPVATNIAFTYQGLKHLKVPDSTLHGFPEEFAMGMMARRDILGDSGPSAPRSWDPIWNAESDQPVHILVAINGRTIEDVERRYQEIIDLQEAANRKAGQGDGQEAGIVQLTGHRDEFGADSPYQDAAALEKNGKTVPEEHFGYMDGISDPFFKGSGAHASNVIGGGKPTGGDPSTKEGWAPLETGEFLLGHKDEASEYPKAPMPPLFSHNGTFMVYRKLHQNVGSFNKFLSAAGSRFPGGAEALAAKFAGRWRNGAPLTTFPTWEEADSFARDLDAAQAKAHSPNPTAEDKAYFETLVTKLNAFDYGEDLAGANCPRGAHIRRTNPRSSLEFGVQGAFDTTGALSNRRRILRRGLPYGKTSDDDKGNHGIILMILNADIGRQFEFVQQQWINFGNDFRLANDRDPLLGNHALDADPQMSGRMIIEGDAASGRPPYFCRGIPTLVETRGGDYFFVPSLTALRMIGKGIIDPT
jgi:deferrochelatase/peroxidase EfeB